MNPPRNTDKNMTTPKLNITQDNIKQWLYKRGGNFTPEELDHIADCLYSIVRWWNDGLMPSDFIAAILKNDLMTACQCADDINIRALPTYASFLYNVMPSDYRRRASL